MECTERRQPVWRSYGIWPKDLGYRRRILRNNNLVYDFLGDQPVHVLRRKTEKLLKDIAVVLSQKRC